MHDGAETGYLDLAFDLYVQYSFHRAELHVTYTVTLAVFLSKYMIGMTVTRIYA